MLEACEAGRPPFPPNVLFNEGWLLRIVVDWFERHGGDRYPLSHASGSRWFSEAWLPSAFLPRYRGAAPIQWAVLNGERETGVTTMLIDEGLDTGPTLLARSIPIGPEETAPELEARLGPLGAEVLLYLFGTPGQHWDRLSALAKLL